MFLLKRLAFLVPLLLVISFLAFVLVRVAPGGPFDKERTPASPDIERNLKARYHLDEPLWRQYLRYLGGLAVGDFGPSLKYRNHTVSDIMAQGLPVSLTLGLLAFAFAQGVGIPLGFYTAARRGRWGDWAGSFLAVLAVCVPGFVVGPLLVMGFAIHWKWLPPALWESPAHAILPTLALGLYFAGRIARLMREGLLAKVEAASGARLTITDILIKVCAQALSEQPEVNVAFAESGGGPAIVRQSEVNVGVAVALEQGLVVPVVHHADRLTLAEIARRRSDLVERARAGKLGLQDLEGGTFTVSNLGMFGVDQFQAIINSPQSAILAVGRVRERPVAVDGAVVVRPTLFLTLSVDHRLLDGAQGARFLERVAQLIAEPYLLLG